MSAGHGAIKRHIRKNAASNETTGVEPSGSKIIIIYRNGSEEPFEKNWITTALLISILPSATDIYLTKISASKEQEKST